MTAISHIFKHFKDICRRHATDMPAYVTHMSRHDVHAMICVSKSRFYYKKKTLVVMFCKHCKYFSILKKHQV